MNERRCRSTTPMQKRPDEVGGTGAPPSSRIEISVRFDNGGRLTPNDIELIEAVRTQRSILAASRVTGVSYRKCWLTVDALNRMFETPVFATYPGRRGGGAELTVFGERLVALFKSMARRSRATAAEALGELSASLNRAYEPRASAAASEDPLSRPRALRSPRT